MTKRMAKRLIRCDYCSRCIAIHDDTPIGRNGLPAGWRQGPQDSMYSPGPIACPNPHHKVRAQATPDDKLGDEYCGKWKYDIVIGEYELSDETLDRFVDDCCDLFLSYLVDGQFQESVINDRFRAKYKRDMTVNELDFFHRTFTTQII